MLRIARRIATIVLGGVCVAACGQTPQPAAHERELRGGYGPYRANNHLLSYHLDLRVDPDAKSISGKNTIRFRMLTEGTRIQIDLADVLQVDRILLLGAKKQTTPLKFTRDGGSVFIDFPAPLRAGQAYAIDFYYSGHPQETGRFGCITFKTDAAGRPWVTSACEEVGPGLWWPNKDQWRDRPESIEISVAVPSGLMDVSNGKLLGHHDLHDGYTRWDWRVTYPINNYDVALNVGAYVHFTGGKVEGTKLDYYALPEDLERAKQQFAQAPEMLRAFTHYFGSYPFQRDGYKVVQAPYAGMEHQSAIAYGNGFANGYLGRDWTGVGISPRFDFILIHESAHEWFGNSVTAADRADMWIHEGWATYLEGLYVEYRWGHEDAVRYLNGLKPKIKNTEPILMTRGVDHEPTEDQYFKGGLMLNTLRSVVNDDAKWFAMIRGFYQQFQHRTILTEDVEQYFDRQSGMKLSPIFEQYLRRAAIPVLELRFHEGAVDYRWSPGAVDGFAMPVQVGDPQHWQTVTPTHDWQTMPTTLTPEQFQVATDLYYVAVKRN